MFPTPPANYQAGNLNSKQPVPTLAGEICFFILRVSEGKLVFVGTIDNFYSNIRQECKKKKKKV